MTMLLFFLLVLDTQQTTFLLVKFRIPNISTNNILITSLCKLKVLSFDTQCQLNISNCTEKTFEEIQPTYYFVPWVTSLKFP